MHPLVCHIRDHGPVSVATFMDLCLAHPTFGYYMTRDPFGAQGDFITAPEISQLFGEMIALYFLSKWQENPQAYDLVELGPGRGTFMADFVRTVNLRPAFLAQSRIHLVEMSPVLREIQQKTLERTPGILWHDRLEEALGDHPLFLVANEFLDALPCHQYMETPDGWRERGVGVTSEGKLEWCVLAAPVVIPAPPVVIPAKAGTQITGRAIHMREVSPLSQQIIQTTLNHLSRFGGCALFIDYGYGAGGGDTLQAVKNHCFVDPLEAPGESDLTVHVAFEPLLELAKEYPKIRANLLSQGDFLRGLGIEIRADQLRASLSLEDHKTLDEGLHRLVDPDKMGDLFKVLILEGDLR